MNRQVTGMKRRLALLAIVCTLNALPAYAQNRGTAPADSAGAAKVVGTWDGSFQTDHGPTGSVRLSIAWDRGWHASMRLTADEDVPGGPVSGFKVDGNRLSWTVELMGMSCSTTAVLEGETMKGQTACEQGSMTFVLNRAKAGQ